MPGSPFHKSRHQKWTPIPKASGRSATRYKAESFTLVLKSLQKSRPTGSVQWQSAKTLRRFSSPADRASRGMARMLRTSIAIEIAKFLFKFGLLFISRDVPNVSIRILNACAALLVGLVRRLGNRSCASLKSTLIRRVNVFHIYVDRRAGSARMRRVADFEHNHRV